MLDYCESRCQEIQSSCLAVLKIHQILEGAECFVVTLVSYFSNSGIAYWCKASHALISSRLLVVFTELVCTRPVVLSACEIKFTKTYIVSL